MGEVVLARHVRLKTEVALKFLKPQFEHDEEVVARFEREARAASRFRSVHSCRVFDFERDEHGHRFIAMEYLHGETLEARRHREPRLTEPQIVAFARQALEALDEAHHLHVVHRDLKPANLFLAKNRDGTERLVVLDFGLAKSTNPDIEHELTDTTKGRWVGSPAYMSPEQLTSGAAIDHRTDFWSLGATLFVLLTGEYPFAGQDLLDMAFRIRNQSPRALPDSTSRALRMCIHRCLEKDPARRFQSARAFQDALSSVEVTLGAASARRIKRRWAVAAALIGGITAAGALTWKPWASDRRRPVGESAEVPLRVDPPRAEVAEQNRVFTTPSEMRVEVPGAPVRSFKRSEKPAPKKEPMPPAEEVQPQATPVEPLLNVSPDAGEDDVFGRRL
jgi:serine/threonine-protein kinase